MIRFAHQDDLPFLRWMLYEAAYPEYAPRPPFEQGLADPRVAVYLDGWMRRGDAGLVVTTDAGGPVGAAWYRLYSAGAPGYGFVDESTPELAIALVYEARGRGIGTELLRSLMTLARKQGHRRLSLSVDPGNPAKRLYERVGFAEIGRGDGDVYVMVADLPEPPG